MGRPRALFALLLLASCAAAPRAAPDIGEIGALGILPAAQKLLIAQVTHAPSVVLTIDSVGGEMRAMQALSALIHSAEATGTRVICVVEGDAMSAGFYLLQQCSERIARPDSKLMWHEMSAVLREDAYKPGELASIERDLRTATHEASIEIARHLKISAEELERRIADRDYFLSAAEALEIGAIDRIEP